MARRFLDLGARLLIGVGLLLAFGGAGLKAQESRPAPSATTSAPPYNIVFVIVDQRAHRLLAGPTTRYRPWMRSRATA